MGISMPCIILSVTGLGMFSADWSPGRHGMLPRRLWRAPCRCWGGSAARHAASSNLCFAGMRPCLED